MKRFDVTASAWVEVKTAAEGETLLQVHQASILATGDVSAWPVWNGGIEVPAGYQVVIPGGVAAHVITQGAPSGKVITAPFAAG